MTSPRRIGAPDAKNRTVLLDATEQLMLEDGYAAVTSRRVAAKAGLKPQLVHYYFRTMDELFLAVLQRHAEAGLQAQAQALASDQPLRALWEFSSDATGTAMTGEFVALANHRKTVKAALADYSERFRIAQVEALTDLADRYGIDTDEFPPALLSVLLTSISRVVVMEEALGFSAGHAETRALVERHLQRLEGNPKPADAQSSTS